MRRQPIAILDSGVGGLTVAKEIMRQIPHEQIVYFGDTARAPYGPREPGQVREFTMQVVQYLLRFDPKMIVMACNTATAFALDEVKKQVHIPLVGVIHPGAREAIKSTKNGLIGVIGTEGTINSGAYVKALKNYSTTIEVVGLSCPLFVPVVERGCFHGEEVRAVVRDSLAPLMDKKLDCLILGCTHYPFLSDEISSIMGCRVQLINSAEETAREVSVLLYHRGKLAQASSDPPVHSFMCSGEPDLFRSIALELLGEELQVKPVVWQVTHMV